MTRQVHPPRWFVVTAWRVHRALFRLTRGRVGLREPRPGVAGMMRLHTTGRASGEKRAAIVCYVEDGDRFVTLAMNGWGDPPPQWWRNLLADPAAETETRGGRRQPVRARAAQGNERDRLWDTLRHTAGWGDIDGFASARAAVTPIVVLEPPA